MSIGGETVNQFCLREGKLFEKIYKLFCIPRITYHMIDGIHSILNKIFMR